MIDLLDLTPVVEKIKSECPVFGSRVYMTVPDDDLSIDLLASPVAFVYLAEDSGDDNNNSNRRTHRQKIQSLVIVKIVIRKQNSKTDKFNTGLVEKARQYRSEVFTALLGFEPQDSHEPISFSKGKLKISDKTIAWRDAFDVTNRIVKQL